jgi:FAD/FMN-containing dehydrogenase
MMFQPASSSELADALRAASADGSGPRRYGCGTIRDWMIGIKVALADGRIIKSGGKVVKNVAGYDLGKVFIGSRGSLGLIVEATFKLRPLPETERFVQTRCASLTKAGELIDAVIGSEMTPVVLDLRRLSTLDSRLSPVLVLGFAGTREEVEWQIEQARGLGLGEAANLDYETEFWSAQPKPQCLSVLPSALVEAIGRLGNVPFVARAGNGVIYYRGGPTPPKNNLPLKLMQRLKDEFDPRHILPDLPL